MKFILFILVFFIFSGFSYAQNSGELVAGGYYLDDLNQTISPSLGIQTHHSFKSISNEFYFGGGYIAQPYDLSGNQEDGWYTELKYDLYYAAAPQLKVGAGIGWISNRSAFQQFDDHVHLTLAYKLW